MRVYCPELVHYLVGALSPTSALYGLSSMLRIVVSGKPATSGQDPTMDDNPYRAEAAQAPAPVAALRERAWSSFCWAVIGFGAGTGFMAPFILSADSRERIFA